MAYTVTTFDVCALGFERLRSYSELIVATPIGEDTTGTQLLDAWLYDVDHCDRPDDFDFDAARTTIRAYYDSSVAPLFASRTNPFNLEPVRDDSDEGCYCYAFLFIKVDGAHFPVY